MGYFPFFTDITGKHGVIVGGGKVAARKIEKLLAFEPRLTVIAPDMEECIRVSEDRLRESNVQGRGCESVLRLVERAFRMEDLDGADFVIAATDDETLNGSISEYCMARRIPVNVVDDKKKCSFYFPALVREGALTIGISTDGKSPAAASYVRKEIAGHLPAGLGMAIDLMGQIRPRVMAYVDRESDRKDILEKMFLYCMEREGNVTAMELEERFLSNLSDHKAAGIRRKEVES